MPSHSTHINYYTRPACMGLGTLKITNFPIINRTAGLRVSFLEGGLFGCVFLARGFRRFKLYVRVLGPS